MTWNPEDKTLIKHSKIKVDGDDWSIHNELISPIVEKNRKNEVHLYSEDILILKIDFKPFQGKEYIFPLSVYFPETDTFGGGQTDLVRAYSLTTLREKILGKNFKYEKF